MLSISRIPLIYLLCFFISIFFSVGISRGLVWDRGEIEWLVSIKLGCRFICLGGNLFLIIPNSNLEPYCIFPSVVKIWGNWSFLLDVVKYLYVNFFILPKIEGNFPCITSSLWIWVTQVPDGTTSGESLILTHWSGPVWSSLGQPPPPPHIV